MRIELVEDTDDQLRCTMTRGNRAAFVYRVPGGDSDDLLEEVEALEGATWVVQVKAAKTDDDPVAEFEVIEVREDDTLTLTFHADDTSDMEAGVTYYFDALVVDGPLAPKTYFAGSTIHVEQDTSRETAS